MVSRVSESGEFLGQWPGSGKVVVTASEDGVTRSAEAGINVRPDRLIFLVGGLILATVAVAALAGAAMRRRRRRREEEARARFQQEGWADPPGTFDAGFDH